MTGMTEVQPHSAAQGTSAIPIASDLINRRIVLWYFVASLIFLTVAMLAGWLYSFQFLQFYPLPGLELLSPGRWRMVHTNAVAYGFLANAFLGAMHWAIPRLTLRRVLDVRLSWFLFWAWQVVLVSTVVGIVAGHAQAVEWGETPIFVDPLALAALVLAAINFLPPIFRMKGPMYVSLWFFISAFVWTAMAYAMGNYVPQFFVSGTAAGAVAGLFLHDLVGLFVTPLGLGLMYYFVPVILKKPIWSHRLALVGFWGLAFFYPLNGIHHFLYSPIPMFLQYGAIIATIAVTLVVATVIINFFLTIRGCGDRLRTQLPIRWFYLGMVFYVTTCLQGAFQVTLTFQRIIHFTDWVVGHSHLALFGVFGFWILGMMTYLMPRLLGAGGWYRPSWNLWHFRLTGIGLLIMFLDLVIAGLVQGFQWRGLAPWEASILASMPFWFVRTATGIVILVGQVLFIYNVLMTAIHKGSPAPVRSEDLRGARATTA